MAQYRRSYAPRRYYAPRRPYVQKRPPFKICRNIQVNPTATQQNVDLYTAGDSIVNRTLTSTKIQGSINFTAAATVIMAVVRVPETTSYLALGTGSGSDVYPVDEHVLWSKIVAGDNDIGYNIDVDSKAMRKMRPGDKIAFLAYSSVAGAAQIAFSYTMFLKN